jgi:hypothetical protein
LFFFAELFVPYERLITVNQLPDTVAVALIVVCLPGHTGRQVTAGDFRAKKKGTSYS